MAGDRDSQRSQRVPPRNPYSGSGSSSDSRRPPAALDQGSIFGPNPFSPESRSEPARPLAEKKGITNTRVELPSSAYALNGEFYNFSSPLPNRPGTNTTGRAIQIRLNQFKVLTWTDKDIFQYDIHIGNGAEKRGKIMAVWKSDAVQKKVRGIGSPMLWDGNKLAWCDKDLPDARIMVDLDAEKGRPPRHQPDRVYCVIKKSKVVRMAVIKAFLERKIPFDNSVLEAINFLDHVLRKTPSEQYTAIKRSFFARGVMSHPLDNVIVALKGVYSSMRLCSLVSSVGPGSGLAINVDVANGTFWAAQDVHQAARNLCKTNNRTLQYPIFRDLLAPTKDRNGRWIKSDAFKELSKMSKLSFRVKHRGTGNDNKIFVIRCFTQNVKAGVTAHAKNTNFSLRGKDGVPDKQISVYDYFKMTYNIDLQYWYLPLIETVRGGMIPMEVASLMPNQRYLYKLSPEQTSAMIKFAVTRPKQRVDSIQHGIGMLNWSKDPILLHYDLQVEPNMTVTNARLLQNPEVQFDKAKVNPGTSGRWDLRGKKFYLANPEPLKSWGFAIIAQCCNAAQVKNFAQVFMQIYIGHGGKITNKDPHIYCQPLGEDAGQAVASARQAIGNITRSEPQIIFYVLPGRDSFLYERIKKNNECRFALFSQCLNVAHVQKAQPQYCSNVAMKVNAKLGGTTCKIQLPANQKCFFTRPTMILGADVSHATPGSQQASMAAITMSFDKDACRYAAAVQTNGYRVEMITQSNINRMVLPLAKQWASKIGGNKPPQHIYYFRDGVSEGQYAHVLNQEVKHMREVFCTQWPNEGPKIKWTVVVCTKRHHIRLFPKERDGMAGDKNENPLPGTLVERDCTHPFEYDFYLNSHSAIQGTARPVHYHVLLDEAKIPVNEFHRIVYQFCYQYMRSTTPVSMFPAVYYAHLASNRARAHEAMPASEGPRGGQKFEEARQDDAQDRRDAGLAPTFSSESAHQATEAAPLLPLGTPDKYELMLKIRTGMWYI